MSTNDINQKKLEGEGAPARSRSISRRQFGMLSIAALGAVAAPAVLAGCSSGSSDSGSGNGGSGDKKVVVGSKDFTESEILAEIYALALEKAGFTVERKFDIAGSVVHTAITNNEIDLYPGYTGTGLLSVLKLDPITDPQKVYDTVKEEYKKQFNLDWLEMSPASDGQGVAIATKASKQYGITNISELQQHATELRFASGAEFQEREDALPGLVKVYGPFDWKENQVIDNSLKYELLKNDKADVTAAYTTEGQLTDTDSFTLLEDDKKAWPPYNVAPIVRNEIVEKYSDLADVLNKVSAKIDTTTLTKLNAQVDVDKEDYEDVAKTFFESL